MIIAEILRYIQIQSQQFENIVFELLIGKIEILTIKYLSYEKTNKKVSRSKHLKLSRKVLIDIFFRRFPTWNNPVDVAKKLEILIE